MNKTIQVAVPQRLAANNKEAWRAYWEAQGQTWCIELEIDSKRRVKRTEYGAIVTDTAKGIYPFKGVK